MSGKLKDFALEEWRQEFQSEFVNLRQMPCSIVKSYISVLSKFTNDYGLGFIEKKIINKPEEWNENEFRKFRSLVDAESVEIENMPLRDVKMFLKLGLSAGFDDEFKARVRSVEEELRGVEIASSKSIRATLFPLLEERFESKAKSVGGGCWELTWEDSGLNPRLYFDFGGITSGMRYDMTVENESGRKRLITYESLMGFPSVAWDCMRADMVNVHIGILIKCINKSLVWEKSVIREM